MRKLFALTLLILGAFVLLGAQGITLGKGATYGKGMTISPGASGGGSTVVFVNTGTNTVQAASSFSASFTVNTCTPNCAVFAIFNYSGSGSAITAATYGGSSMTSCGTPEAGTTAILNVGCYYLANPPTGANTLALTGNGNTTEIYANLVAFSGVNQSTPVRAGTYQGTNQASGTTIGLTITSDAHDLTLSVVANTAGVTSTNQTSDGINNGGTSSNASDHATTAGATITDTWTVSSAACAMAGLSIQHN